MKTKIHIIIMLLIFSTPVFSKTAEKPLIALYNFKVTGDTENFQYYSFIVPHTISRNIQASNRIRIKRINTLFPLNTNSETSTEEKMDRFFSKLSKAHKDIDFIVTGSCHAEADKQSKKNIQVFDFTKKAKKKSHHEPIIKKLSIKLNIIDIQGGNILSMEQESTETGVIMKDIIDTVSDKITSATIELNRENVERYASSSFADFYRSLSFMTFGFDTGQVRFTGSWENLYNNTQFIRGFLYFDTDSVIPYTGLSLNEEYFSSDNDDKESANPSILSTWNTSLDFHFNIKFSEFFRLSLSAGGGLAFSQIMISPPGGGDPFTEPLSEEKSTDPYVSSGLCMIVSLSNIEIRGGAFYKGIYFNDKPLHMYTLQGGIAFHL